MFSWDELGGRLISFFLLQFILYFILPWKSSSIGNLHFVWLGLQSADEDHVMGLTAPDDDTQVLPNITSQGLM